MITSVVCTRSRFQVGRSVEPVEPYSLDVMDDDDDDIAEAKVDSR